MSLYKKCETTKEQERYTSQRNKVTQEKYQQADTSLGNQQGSSVQLGLKRNRIQCLYQP